MPQGDLVFFPYDVTIVLGAYLVGYFIFVSLFAPRIVLSFKARHRVNRSVPKDLYSTKVRCEYAPKALDVLAVGSVYSVGASEFFLQTVQFILLLGFLYSIAVNQLQQRHFTVASALSERRGRPTFTAAALVTTNLLLLWANHRDTLFYQPATHALFEATHHTLQFLQRGVTPGVLPRLLSVVRASKGLNAV